MSGHRAAARRVFISNRQTLIHKYRPTTERQAIIDSCDLSPYQK